MAYSIGDHVFYASGGVCRIDNIETDPFEGIKDGRRYYVLHSVGESNGTMYVPLDNDGIFLRPIMSRAEADALVSKIPEIEEIGEQNPKRLKDCFAESMRTHEPSEWVRVIKTIRTRRAAFFERSKRLSDSELAFLERAKRNLRAELSLALSIPHDEIENYVMSRLGESNEK